MPCVSKRRTVEADQSYSFTLSFHRFILIAHHLSSPPDLFPYLPETPPLPFSHSPNRPFSNFAKPCPPPSNLHFPCRSSDLSFVESPLSPPFIIVICSTTSIIYFTSIRRHWYPLSIFLSRSSPVPITLWADQSSAVSWFWISSLPRPTLRRIPDRPSSSYTLLLGSSIDRKSTRLYIASDRTLVRL